MEYLWLDYDPIRDRAIDEWKNDAIQRFVLDDVWSDSWNYYLTCDEYQVGQDVVCKTVVQNEQIIGALIIFCTPDYPVSINPIIVNPNYQNRGHGERIIKEFLTHIDEILPSSIHSDTVRVGIDIENTASIRLFTKCGFVLESIHPDGDFAFYSVKI